VDHIGYFTIGLTLDAPSPERVAESASWADGYSLGFSHTELRGEPGDGPEQREAPFRTTVTFHGKGVREQAFTAAEQWTERLSEAGFAVLRTRIGVPRDASGVPARRALVEAVDEPWDRYFETGIRLLLPPRVDLDALARIVAPHRAGLCRDVNRDRRDGYQEWLIVQRCSRVGRGEAKALSWPLLRALELAGVSMDGTVSPGPRFLSVECQYVVHDSAVSLDAGWLGTNPVPENEEIPRYHPPLVDPNRWPHTYLPNTAAGPGAEQGRVFDPALKHFADAYTAGEPVFADPQTGDRWWSAHRRAMGRALRAIMTTAWRDHLVLRGSMAMPLWVGEAARRPRDLDFVVVPAETAAFGDPAERMLTELVDAVTGAGAGPEAAEGAGAPGEIVFDPRSVRQEDIWTYERAQGKRLVFPWRAEGLPPGTVQVDVVFNEALPATPVRAEVAGTEVLTVGPELSLAWKVQWLLTDMYPQGKDLYDAVLLAERTPLSRELLLPLLRPELGDRAEEIDETALRPRDGVQQVADQEWSHFVRDCPWVAGGPNEWIDRFEAALAPTFREVPKG
jgi:hypothetical protein